MSARKDALMMDWFATHASQEGLDGMLKTMGIEKSAKHKGHEPVKKMPSKSDWDKDLEQWKGLSAFFGGL